jgi:pimeloyl-ACP methyl ester carboxylesterase
MRMAGFLCRMAAVVAMLALAGCTSSGTRSAPQSAAERWRPPPAPPGFTAHERDVNGTRLYYVIGGQGGPVVLLHGFAQTGHMWTPLLSRLAEQHTVVVPDLRGAGGSAKPADGYDKKTMAVDIHELVRQLGLPPVDIVGHDIGLMVAYAYAAQFPQDTRSVVLLDAFLPGIGNWQDMWLLRDLWHFHFHGETPQALVSGRERIYLEHFWNDFAADRKHSVSEADRRLYSAAYAQPGAVQAGFEWFRNFERDAADFAELGQTRLTMPVLVLAGEKSGGTFLVDQVRLVADDVRGQVVQGSGHWLMDEAPQVVVPAIVDFIGS